MIKDLRFWLIAVSCLFSGCVVSSEQPFYTEANRVAMPDLNGKWYFQDAEGEEENHPLEIKDGLFTVYDEDGVPGTAEAVFFKIDGQLFVDILPDSELVKASETGPAVERLHLLNKVVLEGDRMTISSLDYEWLKGQIEAGVISLPHRRTEPDGTLVFTPSPSEWELFLTQYLNDPAAFPKATEGILIRR